MTLRGIVVGSVVLTVVALPVTGLLALTMRGDTISDARRSVAPVTAASTARTIDDAKPSAAAATLAPGIELRAGGSGTITSVLIAPGSALSTGAGVFAADGILRVAAFTEEPFFRPLQSGDRGPDVVRLNDLLFRLGHLAAADRPDPEDRYTFATAQAVRSLELGLGFATTTGAFDPAWVVWLPREPIVIGEVLIGPGMPAPAAGAPIAREAQRLTRAVLQPANPQETLTLDPAVAWVFVAGKQRFSVDPATLEIAPASLPELQKLLKPKAERIDGVVQRAEPLNVVAVPSTAIQTGRDGKLCAWLPEGATYRAVTVTVASARAGVTNVRTGVTAGQEVLANPADVLKEAACPSP